MAQLSAWRQFSELIAGKGIPNKAMWPHWVEETKTGGRGGQDGSNLRSRVLERRMLCRERGLYIFLVAPLKVWLNPSLLCMYRMQFHRGTISGEAVHWEAVSRTTLRAHTGLGNIWVPYSQSRKISLNTMFVEIPEGSCLSTGAKLVLN